MMGKRIGFGITASHCTYEEVVPKIQVFRDAGAVVVPIVSQSVVTAATRFGTGDEWIARIEEVSGEKVIQTIADAEPLGPKAPLDCMVIAPMTGTSLSKFVHAINDSPVLMAAKATLRTNRPVVIGISSNDILGANGVNVMTAINMKDVYIVPFGQDDPHRKPKSCISDFNLLYDTVESAIDGKQLQPILLGYAE
ncbi:dipicolinate synthase subunit B [Paenisporosarcina cavernae]|uniref:Dipicolinate synthase subunit B n=1 Tax=Paenisporosarcina cavernae TaxID=2320858 RepID=A0A385YRC8_9BACL|nr:dipicolinate synthase subunit B [Paenisporosarcina cavernae]AYC29289.1 dipicolinate synthase subunit B [Paenisporosarcina cavernae]